MSISNPNGLWENKEVKDSFQAFLVENAYFTRKEEYPILPKAFISNVLPEKILPFSKAITTREDLTNTFICFYSPDETFERVRRNPKKYISFFKRTAGIIGFDFSIHSDMPIVKQKAQMYDNLSLTYFFAKEGIPIIPNLRCGVDELMPEFFEAIPKNCIVSIGTHGFCKEIREKCEIYYFIDKVIKELQPKSIIVYGTLSSNMFDDLKKKSNIIVYPSWIDGRFKEVKNDVI